MRQWRASRSLTALSDAMSEPWGTAEENAAFSATGLFSWLCVCE